MSTSAGSAATVSALGEQLKNARDAQRMTLDVVAQLSGLTKGYISKLERGIAQPSVASLVDLCAALGLSMGDMFDPTSDQDLVRVEDRNHIPFGGLKLKEALLTPQRERRLQVISTEIEPGGGSGDGLYALPCEVEFVYVVSGELTLTVNTSMFTLRTGDAMTFNPRDEHAFSNGSDTKLCEVLWILAPSLPRHNHYPLS